MTGSTNTIAYWSGSSSLSFLNTSTYPSLTELSYVKGATSAIQTQIDGKQNSLVSGTNIKTINSSSILGSGNLVVSGVPAGSSSQIQYNAVGSFAGSDELVFSPLLGLTGNDSGNSTTDLRWETDTLQYAFWIDASSNSIYIGYDTYPPISSNQKLWINSSFGVSGDPSSGLGTFISNGMQILGDTSNAYYSDTSISLSDGAMGTSIGISTADGYYHIGATGQIRLGNSYLNFSSTIGSTGYGVRNNSGTVEAKNSGGTWSPVICSDTAYAASWDGVTTQAPSKNAVYDAMELRAVSGAEILASDVTTSSTTAVNTNLSFSIAENEIYTVHISGTAKKATSSTGLKLAIAAPAGCAIKGVQYGGGATLAAALTPSLITAINTLGTTFATGINIEVAFSMVFQVTNGANAGSITLQFATVTSNVATIFAGTNMRWVKSTSV